VRLATIRTASGSAAVRIEDDGAPGLGFPDPGQLSSSCVAERAESR
jgi:hypothetical protein